MKRTDGVSGDALLRRHVKTGVWYGVIVGLYTFGVASDVLGQATETLVEWGASERLAGVLVVVAMVVAVLSAAVLDALASRPTRTPLG
jgi:uncharacterized protein HemY